MASNSRFHPSGVGLAVSVAGLGSEHPEFKPLAVELTTGRVESACHPFVVSKMGTSVLVTGALDQRHIHAPKDDSDPTAKLPYTRRRGRRSSYQTRGKKR